jgi:zinc-binding alcohol dehydrogenase family protein
MPVEIQEETASLLSTCLGEDSRAVSGHFCSAADTSSASTESYFIVMSDTRSRLEQTGSLAGGERARPRSGRRHRRRYARAIDQSRRAGRPDQFHWAPVCESTSIDTNTLYAAAATVRVVFAGHRGHFMAMNRAIGANRLKPIVDRVFPFDDALQAFEYYDTGKAIVKIVIRRTLPFGTTTLCQRCGGRRLSARSISRVSLHHEKQLVETWMLVSRLFAVDERKSKATMGENDSQGPRRRADLQCLRIQPVHSRRGPLPLL